MNISARAAQQLHNLDPDDCAKVLDCLRDHRTQNGVQVVTIETASGFGFKAFVGQHKDGSLVLISVVEARPRAP